MDMHVAIVGAGIGGLALAIALHNKGIPFTLYEESKEYSAVGAGIGFGPNGLRAMDLIEPGFRPKYEKICVGNKGADAQHIFFEGMLLRKGFGKDQPWYGNSAWGHPDFDRKSAHRKTLLDIMTNFMPSKNVKFSKRLESIDERAEKVILSFADGETAEASIVVGADGISSRVREHVLKPEHPEQTRPVYAGSYCYRAVIPMDEAEAILGDLTHVAKFYFGYRRSAVTYRISEGREFNFLLCVATDTPWPRENAVTEEVPHDLMMADFVDPDVDDRFRQLLSKARPIRWGLFHHPMTSTYHRGRMVLVGDSAHASLPFQAAGAAQGIEDAVVLSSVLEAIHKDQERDQDSSSQLSVALDAYDSIRRPRAQRQLEQSAEVARMLFFQHEETGKDMEKILARLQNGRFDWLWFHDVQEDVDKALLRMKR